MSGQRPPTWFWIAVGVVVVLFVVPLLIFGLGSDN
jgi:uncharacterized membrane protein YidH (DUF202 family)